MSVDYLEIICDTSNDGSIQEIRDIFNSLVLNGTDGLNKFLSNKEQLHDYERIISFTEHVYIGKDVMFGVESVIEDVGALFDKILKLFHSLGVRIYRCTYTNSGGGYPTNLQLINDAIEWNDQQYLPINKVNIYISGYFVGEWEQPPRDLIIAMGGCLSDLYVNANLLVIGNEFDPAIREYFLTHNLPVIGEEELEFLFEDALYV